MRIKSKRSAPAFESHNSDCELQIAKKKKPKSCNQHRAQELKHQSQDRKGTKISLPNMQSQKPRGIVG